MLQDFVEAMANGIHGGKAIITPHETENVLLIYVEANNRQDLQKLASHVLGEINARYKDHGVDLAAKAKEEQQWLDAEVQNEIFYAELKEQDEAQKW